MRVRVHRNLHTKRWVVTVKRRKVADYAGVVLSDCRFIVSEARRCAVVRRRCREVHAWCEGDLVTTGEVPTLPTAARRGTYNPYRAATFTDCETGKALQTADLVWFTSAGMFYR